MGQRITIDSATLMNKGFEVIEACWLFDLPPKEVEVVVHPQSKVHAMVEFADGSVIAQVSATDMRMPIQYALTYPERADAPVPRLDWTQAARWTFDPPDFKKFPLLKLAYEAQETGGSATCTLNAADEVAVEAFLAGRISFPGIAATDRGDPGTGAGAGSRDRWAKCWRSTGNRGPSARGIMEKGKIARTQPKRRCARNTIYGSSQNIWWYLVLIGVMILVHELGHYLAARFFDVKVETFSFGFGPRLVRVPARRNRFPLLPDSVRRIREDDRRTAGRRRRGRSPGADFETALAAFADCLRGAGHQYRAGGGAADRVVHGALRESPEPAFAGDRISGAGRRGG